MAGCLTRPKIIMKFLLLKKALQQEKRTNLTLNDDNNALVGSSSSSSSFDRRNSSATDQITNDMRRVVLNNNVMQNSDTDRRREQQQQQQQQRRRESGSPSSSSEIAAVNHQNESAMFDKNSNQAATTSSNESAYITTTVNGLMLNDLVEICDDIDKMKVLQRGHGEWAEAMRPTLGQIGKIVRIYPDNDLKIEVCGTTWTFNPLAVTKANPFKSNFVLKDLNEELIKAAADGDNPKCEYILNMPGSNVNALSNGYSALHSACQNGHLAIIETLVKYNADLEIEDKDGDRAIHHAAFGNEPKVIEYLHKASRKRSSELEVNSRNKKRQTALHIAVNKGFVQVVKLLIELGCHVSLQDCEGDTPLHDAISKSCETLVHILLDANADLSLTNTFGFNCVQHAALRGDPQLFKLVLDKLKSSRKEWLIDQKKEDGFTALHLASLNNYNSIVALLVQFDDIDLNAVNLNHQSALHLAVERLNYDVVCTLLHEKTDPHPIVDVNMQDKEGNTPLHCLLQNYSVALIRKENLAADGEQQQPEKVKKQSWELVDDDMSVKLSSLLIDHGANIYIKNKKQQTPIDLCNDPDFIKYLIKRFNDRQPATGVKSSSLGVIVETDTECLICSERRRDTQLKPCNHIIGCESCSARCKRCLVCKTEIVERVPVVMMSGECEICSERPASIRIEPCGHVSACEQCAPVLKKCITCRSHVHRTTNLADSMTNLTAVDSGSTILSPPPLPITLSVGEKLDRLVSNDVAKLKQELQGLKEQTTCPVCFDKLKNMVFLCGHSTCQMCGDQINECPICRKPIQKRILIY